MSGDRPPVERDPIFPGHSEMARRMRAFDWTTTGLGPPAGWPRNLKTIVRITLNSRQPMFVWWGPRLINLYNDAYAAFLFARHPDALGRPAASIWPEIWPEVGPRADFAMRQESGIYDEARPLIMERRGFPEETYVTFSYSPIPDDEGGFGGILCPVTDDTQRIIGERQLAALHELAARSSEARTWPDACRLAASALATNPHDLPFVLIYVVEPQSDHGHLAGRAGLQTDHPLAPEAIALDDGRIWPLDAVLKSREAVIVPDLVGLSERALLIRPRGP